ncbi:MAG: hypothetical protein Q9226_000688 [Calogaya cf. arnoldii]
MDLPGIGQIGALGIIVRKHDPSHIKCWPHGTVPVQHYPEERCSQFLAKLVADVAPLIIWGPEGVSGVKEPLPKIYVSYPDEAPFFTLPEFPLLTAHPFRQHELVLETGGKLFSNVRQAMSTIEEDSSAGLDDMLVPACDLERYSHAENLHLALQQSGYPSPNDLVPAPLNLWMKVPVQEGGTLDLVESVSRAAEYL